MSNDINEILKQGFTPTTADDWEQIDFAARELFRPKAPIDSDSLFAGRLMQISKLMDVLYSHGGHAILYGERGVGKTSLARIIHERIFGPAKSIKVLRVGCNPTDTFATIWANVFFNYTWQEKSVPEMIRADPQPFTIYKIAEFLEDRYLIIIDEFDRIEDTETKILMADTIKYFSDNPLRFTVMIVGVGKSITELFGNHPSIRRCCEEIRMPRMSGIELKEILNQRLPKLRMLASSTVIDRIVQLSQGLPGYVHLLGLLAVQCAISDRSLEISDAHLDAAVSHALDSADESTRRDYFLAIQSTKPDNRYREVLLACAMATKNELGQFSASDVCAPYSIIMDKTMRLEHFGRHLNEFCNKDRGPALVRSGKPRRYLYHFNNPLLEPLVMMIRHRPPKNG